MAANATKSNLVTDLRALINKRSTKPVPFLGARIEINKLTLAECTEIQKLARDIDADNPEKGFELLMHVIRVGVPTAADFTEEDFQNFPMSDLNSLSDEVLKYAGMDPKAR